MINTINQKIFNTTPPPPPPRWRTTLTRLSLWPLALLAAALFVLCAQAQAQTNTAATGVPAVTDTDSGTDLTMDGPNEDSVLTVAQGTIADDDGITTFTPTWAWYEADAPASGTPMDSAYSAIAGATAAAFTPLQEHVGKFLRVCAAFEDDDGNDETRCWTSVAAVANTNDVNSLPSSVDFAIGRTSRFRLSDFRHEDEEGDDYEIDTLILTEVPVRALRANGRINLGSTISLFPRDFASNSGALTYTPPDTATVGSNRLSFKFQMFDTGPPALQSGPPAAMTINLVANSAPDFGDAAVGTRIWPPGTTTAPLILPAATGGNGAITYGISPALPDGLAFDADTRTISGTPTAVSAVAEYTLTAADADDDEATLTFGIDPMHPVRLRLRLFLEGPLR